MSFPCYTNVYFLWLADSEEVNAAREHYCSTKDATGALKRMPRWKGIEWQLLRGLETHGDKNNFLGALNFVRKNMLD